MRAHEAVKNPNISATTSAFELDGGLYQVVISATWGGGNAVLTKLGPDGTTYISVSDTFTANGGNTLYLSPGRYRWEITTATAVYAEVIRVPGD